MKIEIQSIKVTIKWWQLALIIAAIILSFKAPELVLKLFQVFLFQLKSSILFVELVMF